MKLIETNSDGRYSDTTPNNETIELAISGRLREWDAYAESDANGLKAFYERERQQSKVSPLWRVLWIAAITLLVGWVGWTMVDAAFDWLWKGLGTR